MKKPFPNPVVVHLLTIAEDVARRGGGRHLRQVARRRAISSGYYALFHALCTICADGLVRWSRTSLVHEVYRALDHGTARRRLTEPAARIVHASLVDIGAAFRDVQEARHVADYGPPSIAFSQNEALTIIDRSRKAVSLIQALDAEARTRLAILLIVSKRRS